MTHILMWFTSNEIQLNTIHATKRKPVLHAAQRNAIRLIQTARPIVNTRHKNTDVMAIQNINMEHSPMQIILNKMSNSPYPNTMTFISE